MRSAYASLAAIALSVPALPALAQADWGNLVDVATGLASPVGIYAAPGDNTRLFILEQNTGRIRVLNVTTDPQGNKTYALAATPFLDLGALDTSNPYFRTAGGAPLTDQTGTVIPRLVRSGGTAVSSGGNTWAVVRGGEQGLLGLAFAPDYATSGKFYINYTMSNPAANGAITWSLSGNGTVNNPRQANDTGRTVIFEFRRSAADAGLADTSTERLILAIPQPFNNHNGGHIVFGPNDGLLYIGMGDGGSGNDPGDRALNPNNLLGKMLRIDVSTDGFPADANRNYAIPAGNPYAGGGGSPEIWARGLRNPWKWSFDRWNGNMWIGDVGQGRWEEIHRVLGAGGPGLNYGWRVREGLVNTGLGSAFDTSSLVAPLYVYPHALNQGDVPASTYTSTQTGVSVAGGIVYRGNAIRPWRGRYIFADTFSNRVWALNSDAPLGAGTPAAVGLEDWTTILRSTISGVTPAAISNIVAFGEDNEGEIFIVQIGGRIRKIVPQGAQPPISDIGTTGGTPGSDGVFDNNDFVVFIDFFFGNDPRADVGITGGGRGVDQILDNNDFVAFIDAFFSQT